MGPQASRSYPGQRLVRPAGPKAERARQEFDYGRRGAAGCVFGALQPATGAALTLSCARRTTANWVDFLSAVETWIDPAVERATAYWNEHRHPFVWGRRRRHRQPRRLGIAAVPKLARIQRMHH